MKSERRHELEHNELADWIGNTILAIKPYRNLILGILILLGVGGAVFAWWRNHSGGQTAEAWDQFYKALDSRNPAKLSEVMEQYPNTHVAHCAALVAADMHLDMGCERLFENKALANQELYKATQIYQTVLDPREGSRNAMLREHATFGLARAYEASGDLDKAVECYEEVGKNWPKGAYAAAAQSRLSDLGKHSTKDWYDRFAQFDPKPFEEQPFGKLPKSGLETFPEEPAEREPDKTFDLKLKGKGAKQIEGFPKPSTEPETTKPSTEPEASKPSAEPETPKPAATPEKDAPKPADQAPPKAKSE
jgi:tetratricopeptide (TPR) repeat protein